jgi:regulator of RNase E activity RraB
VSEDWNSYFCNVNDKLASIRLDLAIRSTVPDPVRLWLLWVWVYFKQPRPDGLSSREEFDRLSSLEETLQAAVEKQCDGILSGCITTSERREFYFYGSTPEGFEETVNQSVGLSHGYKFDCDKQQDPGWTQYLNVLYPSEEQRELIENRKLLDVLQQQGDNLEAARDVHHWASFQNQTDRETFRDAIQVLGYRIESENENPSGEFRYGICIMRRQEMTSDAVDAAVIELFRASKSAHGQYEGWECQVIVDSEPENKKSP